MTGKGHMYVGLVSTLGMYHFTTSNLQLDFIHGVLGAIGLVFGANAPDYLEIRKKNNSTVIKHRTWTHLVLFWLMGLFYVLHQHNFFEISNSNSFTDILQYELNSYILIGLTGFIFGGLLHLLTDLPNPMGIPIFLPNMRFSLKLWKSGKFEPLIIFSFLLVNLWYTGIIEFNLDKIFS